MKNCYSALVCLLLTVPVFSQDWVYMDEYDSEVYGICDVWYDLDDIEFFDEAVIVNFLIQFEDYHLYEGEVYDSRTVKAIINVKMKKYTITSDKYYLRGKLRATLNINEEDLEFYEFSNTPFIEDFLIHCYQTIHSME